MREIYHMRDVSWKSEKEPIENSSDILEES